MRVSFEAGFTASLRCWATSPNGTLRLFIKPRINWPINFWRDQWPTNGACCKSVVILAAKYCFTEQNGFLVV